MPRLLAIPAARSLLKALYVRSIEPVMVVCANALPANKLVAKAEVINSLFFINTPIFVLHNFIVMHDVRYK
jgi:hypothetical protein